MNLWPRTSSIQIARLSFTWKNKNVPFPFSHFSIIHIRKVCGHHIKNGQSQPRYRLPDMSIYVQVFHILYQHNKSLIIILPITNTNTQHSTSNDKHPPHMTKITHIRIPPTSPITISENLFACTARALIPPTISTDIGYDNTTGINFSRAELMEFFPNASK